MSRVPCPDLLKKTDPILLPVEEKRKVRIR